MLAIGDHIGIDAAIIVTVMAHHIVRQVEVAQPRQRVDIHRRASHDPLVHLQPCIADRERLPQQRELVPGRPPGDIEIAPEPQRMHRLADDGFEVGHACEVDDRHHLAGDVRKL